MHLHCTPDRHMQIHTLPCLYIIHILSAFAHGSLARTHTHSYIHIHTLAQFATAAAAAASCTHYSCGALSEQAQMLCMYVCVCVRGFFLSPCSCCSSEIIHASTPRLYAHTFVVRETERNSHHGVRNFNLNLLKCLPILTFHPPHANYI